MATAQTTPTLSRPLRTALVWNGGLLEDRILREQLPVVLGEGPRRTFETPMELGGDVELLTPVPGTGYTLRLRDGMKGKVRFGGREASVETLCVGGADVPVRPGDWGIVGLGPVCVFFQFVADPGRAKQSVFRLDRDQIQSIVFSVVLHLLILVFGFLVLREEPPGNDSEVDPERIAQFLVTHPEEESDEPEGEDPNAGFQDDEEGGKAHEGDEGKFGDKNSPHERTEIPGTDPQLVPSRIHESGMLKALNSEAGARALQSVLSGPSLEAALSGLRADSLVIGRGTGGWGLKGTGTGGGGTGQGNLFGTGELGTGIGRGKGGLGKGDGGLALKGRPTKEVEVTFQRGAPRVNGYLSPEQINRVVRARSAVLRFCYESELQRNPGLRGRIVIDWRINLQGRVTRSSVGSSTMNNPRVEGCLSRQVRSFVFPQPDGGEVQVSYPFLFGVTGG